MNTPSPLPYTRSALAAHFAVSALALAAALLLVGCASPGPAHTPLAQTTPFSPTSRPHARRRRASPFRAVGRPVPNRSSTALVDLGG